MLEQHQEQIILPRTSLVFKEKKKAITDFMSNLGTRLLLPKIKSFVSRAPPERVATNKGLDVRRGAEKGSRVSNKGY